MTDVLDNLVDAASWLRAYARYRAWARNSLPDCSEGRLSAGDIHVHYREYGVGPAVLMLHGGFMFDLCWAAQIPVLAGRFHVVTMDSRGHGRTTLGYRELSYDQMALDASRVIERLGTGPAHVIGWSDGGCTALALALEHPDVVRSIVLIGTPYSIDNYAEQSRKMMESMLEPRSPELLAIRAAWSVLAPEPGRWRDFAEAMRRMWMTQPNHTREDLGRIEAPTLVVACDRDEFLSVPGDPLKVFRETAEAIPHSEITVVPGARHCVLFQRPREVNTAISGFLSRV